MDLEEIKKLLQEAIDSYVEPTIPEALANDERLEDAFKEPICNEEGVATTMPSIWDSNSYGKTRDGILVLSLRSATIASECYSRYLDEPALVWDAAIQELFLYIPDNDSPAVAFKGSRWLCAKRLKLEYYIIDDLDIHDVYKEIRAKIQKELNLKNK